MLTGIRNLENFESEKIFFQEGIDRAILEAGLEGPSDIELAGFRSRPARMSGSAGERQMVPQKRVTEVLVICRNLAAEMRFVGSGGANIWDELTKWAENFGNIDLYFVCRDSDEILELRAQFEDSAEEYAQNLNTLPPILKWCDLGIYQSVGKLIEDQNPKILLDQLTKIAYKKHSIAAANGPVACVPLDSYLLDRTTNQDTRVLKPTAPRSPEKIAELPRSLKLKAVLGGFLVLSWVGMFGALAALLAVGGGSVIIVFGAFALLGWAALIVNPSATADGHY